MPGIHNILIIGPKKSGATQLYHRITKKKSFKEKYSAVVTTRCSPQQYTFLDKELKVQYTDLGSDRKINVINDELKKAHEICLVFDPTASNWEDTLDTYRQSINFPLSTPIVLVGIKRDLLVSESLVQTVEARAKIYANEKLHNAPVTLVSSKTEAGLDSLEQVVLSNLPDLTEESILPSNLEKTKRTSLVKAMTQVLDKDPDFFDEEDLADTLISLGSINSPPKITPMQDRYTLNQQNQSSKQNLSSIKKSLFNEPNTPTRQNQNPTTSGTGSGRIAENNPSAPQEGQGLSLKDFHTPTRRNHNLITPGVGNHRTAANNPPPPADTYVSVALRMVGMTIMLAALTSLIYLAAVAVSLMSAGALTAVVNQMVLTVGGLFGMAAPAEALSSVYAALGLSTTAGASILAANASLLTMGLGYGVMCLGKKSATETGAAAPTSYFALTLRIIGITLLAAAIANLVYLALIATQVISAVAFTSAMNQLIVSIGTILSMAEPLVAFSNAAAAIGFSAVAAGQIVSATSSVVTMGLGYGLFRAGKPAATTDNSAHGNERGLARTPVRTPNKVL